MRREEIKHYTSLVFTLVAGLVLFWLFEFNLAARTAIVIVLSVSYVIWGVVHHSSQKSLHIRVVLEYILVALLASLVVIYLVRRA